MRTLSITPKDIKQQWVVVDATDQPLGRLASQIAYVLRGKHKPTFVPHLECGDHVIVVNADKIKLTGLKWKDKVYYHHTRFIGGIKAITATDLHKKHPERLITTAVKGMLPHNRLGRKVIGHLKVYAGPEHPHASQKPVPMAKRLATKEG